MSTEIETAAIIRSHADALAEADRLRDALDRIRTMHRLNDPDPKETALRMCTEAEDALSSTRTAFAWLEALDRRMKLVGAAEELERLASVNQHRMLDCNDLAERAAKLRQEAEK